MTPKPRGNGALFGATDSTRAARPLAIDATLSLSSAYDDDLSEGQAASTLLPQVGGGYSDLIGGLSLSHKGPHSRVTAHGTSSLRDYPSLHRFVASNYSAGTEMNVSLTRRTTVQASVDAAYVSEFAFDTVSRQSGLGNVALSSTGLDAAALDGARLTYGATAGLTRKVGTRSMFSFTVAARHGERRTVNEEATERTVGTHLSRSVGRDTSVGLGYNVRRYSERLGPDARPAWSNDAEVDIERRWRHSRERRTVMNLSVGPSLLQASTSPATAAQPPATSIPPALSVTRFGLVGAAALSHDMSRSWNLGTSYRRGAGSIDGIASDAATVDLKGLLTSRVELTVSAGYFRSEQGLQGLVSRYTTQYGSSRLQIALTRAVALYGQYVFYDYHVENGGLLAPGFPMQQQQQRRGARAGLTLWMPVHEAR